MIRGAAILVASALAGSLVACALPAYQPPIPANTYSGRRIGDPLPPHVAESHSKAAEQRQQRAEADAAEAAARRERINRRVVESEARRQEESRRREEEGAASRRASEVREVDARQERERREQQERLAREARNHRAEPALPPDVPAVYVGAIAGTGPFGCRVKILLMNQTPYDINGIRLLLDVENGNESSVESREWRFVDAGRDRAIDVDLSQPFCRDSMRVTVRGLESCDFRSGDLRCAALLREGQVRGTSGRVIPVQFRTGPAI